jgi:hypothetical protein
VCAATDVRECIEEERKRRSKDMEIVCCSKADK